MEEYGNPPRSKEKEPKTARRTTSKSMTRWSKKEFVAKVQELETQLAEVTEEMRIFSDEVRIANVCLSKFGLNVCCILSAPVDLCSLCSSTQEDLPAGGSALRFEQGSQEA